MILLSLGDGADGAAATTLLADLAGLAGFLTPPTGAATTPAAGLIGLRVRRPR